MFLTYSSLFPGALAPGVTDQEVDRQRKAQRQGETTTTESEVEVRGKPSLFQG